MSLTIKDGNNDPQLLKTTLDTGELVTHHIVDESALPTGAATAANQSTQTTEITSVKTAAQAVETHIKKTVGTTQSNNFASNLMVFNTEASTPVDTNGAAAAITPAPASGKKIAIDFVHFFETDSGTGAGDGKLVAGDILTLSLSCETSGVVVYRWSTRIVTAGNLAERVHTWAPPVPMKLPTADKKVFIQLLVKDSAGANQERNLTGQCNVIYHDED